LKGGRDGRERWEEGVGLGWGVEVFALENGEKF
jgi:hypothetical protein